MTTDAPADHWPATPNGLDSVEKIRDIAKRAHRRLHEDDLESYEANQIWKSLKVCQMAIGVRPAPADKADADRVFLTRTGRLWVRDANINGGGKIKTGVNAIAPAFKEISIDVGNYQQGRGFYALRHTFETIAGDTADQVAVDHIMGHSDPSMAATYRHRIEDKRLHTVVAHVKKWLFPKGAKSVK